MLTGINIDNDFFVGQKNNDILKKNIAAVSGLSYLSEISVQYFYMRFQQSRHFVFRGSHYLCGINYIKLTEPNGRTHEFGKAERENAVYHLGVDREGHPDAERLDDSIKKFSKTCKSYTSHIMTEIGTLFINGILISKAGILGLQIVDMVESHNNNDCLFYAYRMLKNQGIHSIQYRRHKHSIDYQEDPDSRFRRIVNYYSLDGRHPIYFENFVCAESPDIVRLFNRVCQYVMEDDNASYNIIPECQLIQKCFFCARLIDR